MPPPEVVATLRRGVVIPAHPLAVTAERKLDEAHQRALTRYYLAAGAGGVAVGVHTTQFAIRDPKFGLYRPVLELAARTLDETSRPVARVAGICGQTRQAVVEAQIASTMGYHAGLLSLGAMKDANDDELMTHCRAVAEVISLFGFYLQPSVGGRILGVGFWRRFAEIPNVVAIKIAPFNRYQTLDVVRAVAEVGRGGDIALYTGNDDSIITDLLTIFRFTATSCPPAAGGAQACPPQAGELRIVGGLLGHWAVWTRRAVEMLGEVHDLCESGSPVPQELLTRAAEVTDMNAALFDPQHNYVGCIPGIHRVLVAQGLMTGRWCLDQHEELSPGQEEEIERVAAAYPHLTDDDFVAQHRDEWLR
jgi:hypothetical protein